jgi:hypothetical protein
MHERADPFTKGWRLFAPIRAGNGENKTKLIMPQFARFEKISAHIHTNCKHFELNTPFAETPIMVP